MSTLAVLRMNIPASKYSNGTTSLTQVCLCDREGICATHRRELAAVSMQCDLCADEVHAVACTCCSGSCCAMLSFMQLCCLLLLRWLLVCLCKIPTTHRTLVLCIRRELCTRVHLFLHFFTMVHPFLLSASSMFSRRSTHQYSTSLKAASSIVL